jgi:hypothetical protein
MEASARRGAVEATGDDTWSRAPEEKAAVDDLLETCSRSGDFIV